MLIDEKDLLVFDSDESRTYFKEILQSYYSQNYRATIVMLYSFVIYDLFMKLQIMANEGDKKASRKVKEINEMISDDEKYSKVENEIIVFFKENCPIYFNRFTEDIDYLKTCRNKCAHLKVDDNTLYVPNDYHARMLICSMFDNVLSVKAPFISDLFSIARADVEKYSVSIPYIEKDGLNENINIEIKNKYLKRMTYDSLKKSYKTFLKLLFVSQSEDCDSNVYGLYAFVYSMTDYLVKEGFSQLFSEEEIISVFSRIKIEVLKTNDAKRNALICLVLRYLVVMDSIRAHNDVFEYICDCVLNKPVGIAHYKDFYPRSNKSIYDFFNENSHVKKPLYTETLYNAMKDCENFDVEGFFKCMVNEIPSYNGFADADAYMGSLKKHIGELSKECVEEISSVYMANGQCIKRSKHADDWGAIQEYLQDEIETIEDSSIEDDGIPF